MTLHKESLGEGRGNCMRRKVLGMVATVCEFVCVCVYARVSVCAMM